MYWNKKRGIALMLMFSFVFLIGNVLADSVLSNPSVCCEKTKAGAYCQNTISNNCDSSKSVAPTSCDSTSFCKLGTCYNSKEGLCMENVPQMVCQTSGGTWSEKKANELSQCRLGCCVLADQASFVTMTRCKSLSTFFGIEKMDFRTSINSESSCIAVANSQDEGACVSVVNGLKTCTFTTRQKCGGVVSIDTSIINSSELDESSGKYFYKDFLCSNDELGVPNCARQSHTECYAGKVYWFDSLGNKENVYSSNSEKSWNNGRVASPDEICSLTGESKSCGNCDYLSGSRCGEWDNSFLGITSLTKPKNVNNYCKTTKCKDSEGNTRLNGESWCVYDGEVGNAADAAGSRHYREICTDGKVTVEACDDFRNQICIHSGIQTSAGEYSVATCKINRWQDCTSQTDRDNCENTDARDCLWVEGVDGVLIGNPKYAQSTQQQSSFASPSPGAPKGATATQGIQAVSQATSLIGSVTGNAIKNIIGSGVGQWEQNSLNNDWKPNRSFTEYGICVPLVSPGLNFWESGSSSQTCGQTSATCSVEVVRTYKKNAITGKKELASTDVRENECLIEDKDSFKVNPEWAAKANAVCSAMGDCGAGFNINGVFVNDGYEWKYKNESYFFIEADAGILSRGLNVGTGEVVLDYVINNKYQLKQGETVYIKK